MKSSEFKYVNPSSLDEAVEILERHHGEAKVISGGQSLMPILNYRLASPEILVDLKHIQGLNEIEISSEHTQLGSRVRWVDIECHPNLRKHQPLLCAAIDHVAHYQIRNRGTVGGSLAHADPSAEMPGLAVVLDATISVLGPNGFREIKAKDFFVGQLATSISSSEIIVSVKLPFWPEKRKWGFSEFSRRKGDFAIAGAFVWYDIAVNDEVENIHIGLIGAGEKPIRLLDAELMLEKKKLSAELIREVIVLSLSKLSFQSDIQASEKYRRALMGEMIFKAFAQSSVVFK